MWEDSHEEGSPPARWSEFVEASIDHFLSAETKAARAAKFEILKQGSMYVWKYHMRFVRLSKYAIYMFPTMEARVHQFVQGLSPLVIDEAATAALNSDMNYGNMVAFSQANETRKRKNKMERDGSSKARSPGNFGGSFGGGRSASRGGSSGPSQSFAQSSSTEASPDVVIGILVVQSHDVYALIDPGSTLYNVTPYVSMEFGIEPKQLHEAFSISTPVCESIVAARVNRDYVVMVRGRDTMDDLIELGMVDFDVIMGMSCVSREGIKVDPQKIANVKNWPRPTTLTEIHSLLGLAGYYRKLVEGFSTLSSSLTKMTKKAVKF
ncbi:uncharacterized protein [Nicotiana tomentosiformis]|uniref:uncharacterized protein n=1 Tax=Nicotiana tomentosiformis TaxID=4098 RepID=UPI00388CE027